MGGALILAAAGAALAVLLAVRLWVVLRPRAAVPRRSLSLLVVAGSGGHTTEILRLLETLSDAYSPRHYVIADTDEMSAHKINSFELNRADRNPSTTFPEYHIHRIPRSREVQQSWPSSALSTLYSLWFSFPLTHRVKPDLRVQRKLHRTKKRSAGPRCLSIHGVKVRIRFFKPRQERNNETAIVDCFLFSKINDIILGSHWFKSDHEDLKGQIPGSLAVCWVLSSLIHNWIVMNWKTPYTEVSSSGSHPCTPRARASFSAR
ncbi:UDP-N-acetylglucosamine transferase subunit ALG14 homolog isoform X1 [Sus scrofa]|nr:UDP-N-acetylglucosamine transferase subunit ALG14 homolog isoform X1 [Sus scrofa]